MISFIIFLTTTAQKEKNDLKRLILQKVKTKVKSIQSHSHKPTFSELVQDAFFMVSGVILAAFALKGFLNGSAYHYTQEERQEKVISQLKKYFGSEVEIFESYHDKIWNDQYIQPKEDSFLPPHYNNGHAIFKDSYMNGKLFFTGTETSSIYSGYMEGAVIASNLISQRISQK